MQSYWCMPEMNERMNKGPGGLPLSVKFLTVSHAANLDYNMWHRHKITSIQCKKRNCTVQYFY